MCETDLKTCKKCLPKFFDATKPDDKAKKENKDKILACEACGANCISCNKKETCQQCDEGFKLNSSFVCEAANTLYMMIAIGVIALLLLVLVVLLIKCCFKKDDGDKGKDKGTDKGTELKKKANKNLETEAGNIKDTENDNGGGSTKRDLKK